MWTPQPGPQTIAYESEADEILYGGEPGGGKTSMLLGLALMKHTRSHIFRRDAGQLGEMTDELRRFTEGVGRVTESPRPLWRNGAQRIELAGIANEADAFKWQGRASDLKGFDELTQFSKTAYLTVSGWGRSTVPGQKVQTVSTCNPPVDEDALWVVERWAPWLDPNHPNPAASGEIRWFAMLDGEDTECEDGEPFEHHGETVYPSSRTFIRARLSDNAYLGDEYRRRLDALPEPMRTIFKTSDFMALLQTSHPFQVIPTDWIRQAQKRWTPGVPELPGTTRQVPLSCVALDVAEGGRDRTVKAKRYGDWIAPLEWKPGAQTPHPEDAAAFVEPDLLEGGYVIVDADGVGGQAYGILHATFKNRARAFRGVKPTLWRDRGHDGEPGSNEYANVRAAAWWCARIALDPKNPRKVALPPGNDLLAELAAPRWFMSGQKIQLEKKDDVKERLGRSPDCFVAGTKVLTPHGERNIEDIQINDLVSTPWGDSPVIGQIRTASHQMVTLTLEDGRTLTGKPDHHIFTFERGWVKLVDLTPSDTVSLSVWTSRTLWRLLGLLCSTAVRTGFKRAVKDAAITSDGPLGKALGRLILPSTATSTSSFTAPSLTGTTFITPTTTASTTTRATSSHGLSTITCPSTCDIDSRIPSIALGTRPYSTPSARELLTGIDPTRGGPGIGSTPSSRSERLPLSVRSAAPTCWLPSGTGATAPHDASSAPLLRIADTSPWSGLARAVVNGLSRASIARASRVRSVVRHSYENPEPVYDLTLERHNAYWANGILAENCADAVVMALWEGGAAAVPETYGVQVA